MKYYLHDSNSFNDEKVTDLYLNYGYEGLGLFYTLLEKLAAQEKPIKTSVLKSQLNVGKRLNKCWEFMESIGIIHSNNGETFNKQLLNFSEKYQIKKQKNNEKIRQWRENQSNAENVTNYVLSGNHPKLKESKVKESKVILRIANKLINKSISDFFKENFELFLENWKIQHKEIAPEEIFSRMEIDYLGYNFNNENHLQNTFRSVYEKLKKEKVYGNTGLSEQAKRRNELEQFSRSFDQMLSGGEAKDTGRDSVIDTEANIIESKTFDGGRKFEGDNNQTNC